MKVSAQQFNNLLVSLLLLLFLHKLMKGRKGKFTFSGNSCVFFVVFLCDAPNTTRLQQLVVVQAMHATIANSHYIRYSCF